MWGSTMNRELKLKLMDCVHTVALAVDTVIHIFTLTSYVDYTLSTYVRDLQNLQWAEFRAHSVRQRVIGRLVKEYYANVA